MPAYRSLLPLCCPAPAAPARPHLSVHALRSARHRLFFCATPRGRGGRVTFRRPPPKLHFRFSLCVPHARNAVHAASAYALASVLRIDGPANARFKRPRLTNGSLLKLQLPYCVVSLLHVQHSSPSFGGWTGRFWSTKGMCVSKPIKSQQNQVRWVALGYKHTSVGILNVISYKLMTSRRSKMRGSMSPRRSEIRGSMSSRTPVSARLNVLS